MCCFSQPVRSVHSTNIFARPADDGRQFLVDHSLFCQPTPEQRPAVEEWQESYTHPTRFMRMEQTRRIVLPDQHCYKNLK